MAQLSVVTNSPWPLRNREFGWLRREHGSDATLAFDRRMRTMTIW